MIQVRQAKDLLLAGPLLAMALPFDCGGNKGQVMDMVSGCLVFELLDGAEVVGAFAARADDYSDGRTFTVTAAGGRPGYDLVAVMDAWLVIQAAGTSRPAALTCTTRRPGLIRKLKRAGYSVAGTVMRKEVSHGLA